VNEVLFKIKLSERKAKYIRNNMFSNERKYWILAHQQARDIVNSVAIRFVTGGRYSDLKWIHSWEQE